VGELVKSPCNGTMPKKRLEIKQAGLVDHEQLLRHPPAPAEVLFPSVIENPDVNSSQTRATNWHDGLLAIGVILMIATALVPVFKTNLSLKKVQTVNLIVVLIGVFLLVALLQPVSLRLFQSSEGMNLGHVIAIVLFFGLLGMFRLMSSFESPN
jgi:hypothetical protein